MPAPRRNRSGSWNTTFTTFATATRSWTPSSCCKRSGSCCGRIPRTEPDRFSGAALEMKRALIAAIPYLMLAAVILLRAWDPLPVEQVRFLVFDTYQRLKPRAYDPGAPVRIVDI